MDICNDCQKPIERGQTCYVANPAPGTIHHYHSQCGDPFGIKRAVAAERERCALIAERMNYGGNTEYDKGRANACQDIARAIRLNG